MADEKTRIVPRASPKGGGDSIAFACENGHRINVPAKLAGKRGACSKCGVPVVIPLASAAAEPGAVPAVTAAEQPAAEAGSARIASRDQVPRDQEPRDQEPRDQEPRIDTFANLFAATATTPPIAAEEIVVDITGAAEATGGGSAVGEVVAVHGPAEFAPPDEGHVAENPTAQLVARLWLERAHEGVVEIHLAGGAVPILPEWYEPRWSCGTHGLFASQAADGTVTLTAVAWDAVQKIVVRGVRGLPDGMFE